MVALDSNILLYFEGVDGVERRDKAQAIVGSLRPAGLLVPAQGLGEFFRVATGKAGWPPAEATDALTRWSQACRVQPTTAETAIEAAAFSTTHHFQIWDAIIVCAAAEGGCDMLLSEDMHHGFRYRGVTIVNPFADTLHPVLAATLERLK